jgi:catechol 2,3-dioxygenase-like lactoylglutathione lyase family enzyme
MKTGQLVFAAIAASSLFQAQAFAQAPALTLPHFHHLHLNSVDPDAAIAFYTKEFSSTSRTSWGGFSGLSSPNNVMVLFSKVTRPPVADPNATAYWHFGWNVPDERKALALYQERPDVTLLPLYTTDEGGSVLVNSDTWPGIGSVLGLTKAQIAEAKAHGIQPAGGAGFGYMRGPDNALIEYAGNYPAERFNHVHMSQEDPYCAQLWYQTHLLAQPSRGPVDPAHATLETCKVARTPDRSWPALGKEGMFRNPTAGVIFGDVALNWYMRQTETPLASTRGRLMDHIALGVTGLDAWVAKLKAEKVVFLKQLYKLGDTRAVMLEGPSHEAIELVELK